MSLGRGDDWTAADTVRRAHALVAISAWLYEQEHPPPPASPPAPSAFERHLALMGAPAFALPACSCPRSLE